jgi:sarcosine oxidase gamma subunit
MSRTAAETAKRIIFILSPGEWLLVIQWKAQNALAPRDGGAKLSSESG